MLARRLATRSRSAPPRSRRTARRSARPASAADRRCRGATIVSCCSTPRCLRDGSRVFELVEPVLVEPDRSSSPRAPSHVSAIAATTALESMPPERNAPSGTSLTRRRRTDSLTSASSCSRYSSSRAGSPSPVKVQIPVAADRHTSALRDEQMPRRQLPDRRDTSSAGTGTYCSVRYASSASALQSRGTSGSSRSDLISEPNVTPDACRAVVERLDAEAVADEQQPALAARPTARTRTCRGSDRPRGRPTARRRGR